MENKNTDKKDNKEDKDNLNKKRLKPKEEIGGPKGLEPTRYGDWEKDGRCSDF